MLMWASEIFISLQRLHVMIIIKGVEGKFHKTAFMTPFMTNLCLSVSVSVATPANIDVVDTYLYCHAL